MNYRQRCGAGLIVLSCVLWGFIFLLPWSGLTAWYQVASGAVLYVLNYVCFIAGVWLLGKDLWQGFKAAVKKFFTRSEVDESN